MPSQRTLAFLSPRSLPPPKLLPQIKNDLSPIQKDAFSCLSFELISSKATPPIIGQRSVKPKI
jgi:hypothetical protein